MSNNSSLSPTSSSTTGEKARLAGGAAGAGMWDGSLDGLQGGQEADDYLHNPDPKRDHKVSSESTLPQPAYTKTYDPLRAPVVCLLDEC